MVYYFQELFTSSNPTNLELANEVVRDKLSLEHKIWCEKPYSSEEINEAIQQMLPLKAPGPDGLPTFFLPKVLEDCWERYGGNGVSNPK